MEIYKLGKTISIGKTYIIFESGYSGNIVYVPNVNNFKVSDDEMKLFVYKYETEYSAAIYGFRKFKERLLFEDLIALQGIGPKTAIGLLKDGGESLMEIIANKDIDQLSSFPYLGIKTANQIIFELSDKYKNMKNKKSGMISPSMVKDSLKTLGFNNKQIDYAVKTIKPEAKIELLVENAIKAISNAKLA